MEQRIIARLSLIYHLRVSVTGHIALIAGLYSTVISLFGPHQVTWQTMIPFLNLVLCFHSFILTDLTANSSSQILWLDGNNIPFVEENTFMNTSLKELRINDNKITHLPELKATRLIILDIRRNLLSEVGFLSLLPALTSVRLDMRIPFPH